MILQTLLVSKDDLSAELLIKVLVQFGVVVDRSNALDVAMTRLADERFDQLIVDFDPDFDSDFNDPSAATALLERCRGLVGPEHCHPITIALLRNPAQIRSILGAGAHFILNKPLVQVQVENTFRAATAMLKRERRQSLRVAVQAEISIRTRENDPSECTAVEGILLDLSTGGMDVLAAKPLPAATIVNVAFDLPGGSVKVQADAEVAWSTPNGQIGLRFVDMDANIREQVHQWLAAHSQDALSEESEVHQCKLTDLSLGACYVQTESPFPQSSAVDLCLRAAGMEIHTEGLVRVMHPCHGMGIEFPARTEQQRHSVEQFIDFLTSQPDAAPQLEISPRSLVANAVDLKPAAAPATENGDTTASEQASGEAMRDGALPEDPLLDLLRNGSTLDEEAFLAELQRQRNPVAVTQ